MQKGVNNIRKKKKQERRNRYVAYGYECGEKDIKEKEGGSVTEWFVHLSFWEKRRKE